MCIRDRDWGEMILERILEDSGLTKDREYFTQFNIKNENGENQRPDFVLKLPGNQLVIIDSKVSLNAYERMVSAENEEDRKMNLQLHIAAVKKHIDTLAQKRYDNLKDALDFTIMFIPVEPAFLTAVPVSYTHLTHHNDMMRKKRCSQLLVQLQHCHSL